MHEQSLSLLTFCVDTDDMEDISIDIKIIIFPYLRQLRESATLVCPNFIFKILNMFSQIL